MPHQLIALLLGVLTASTSLLMSSQAASNGCLPDLYLAGICGSASNDGTQVDILGTKQTPGGSTQPRADGGQRAPEQESPPVGCAADPDPMCRESYSVGLLPDVTLADLASFVPARPSLTGEPAGLGVVGMPTNLVAQASEQRIPGTLFDYEVVVRFVPSAFRFDHGDGTSQTTATGGSTWAALGQAEFTPTPTSHVYRARGTYDVSVTVLYRASVDFGNGWRPVDGYVEATTSGYDVRIVEVHTALVDKTCLENPSGPGC